MSKKLASSFIERMKTDELFSICVGQAESKEVRWSIITENGYHFTESELNEVSDDYSQMLVEASASETTIKNCSGGDPGCDQYTA